MPEPLVGVGTTGYLVAGIALALLAVLALRPILRDWRAGGDPSPPSSWAYSERLWIAWERASVPAYLGVVFGLVPVAVFGALEPDQGFAYVVWICSAFITVAFIGLSLLTAVFGRPKFLIAKKLREQPSLLRELLED